MGFVIGTKLFHWKECNNGMSLHMIVNKLMYYVLRKTC